MSTLRCNRFLAVLTCGAWLLAATGAAHAASIITITLDSPVDVMAGNLITVDGTLTNTTTLPVFLNSIDIDLTGFSSANLDPTPFYSNTPISLDGNASTGDVQLFTVTVPYPFASGPYAGTFTLVGGSSDSSQTIIGSADFTVEVGSSGSVPEPASAALLAAGMVLIIACARKRAGRIGLKIASLHANVVQDLL